MTRLLCLSLLFAAAAAAEEPSVTVVVPVVASAVGASGARWKTQIELRNDMRTEATVALSLPAAKDQPTILLTIPPGGVQRFGDIVAEAFSLEDLLSPLVVQTAGSRSVRVNANAYSVLETTVTRPQPIPVMDAASYSRIRVLPGLAWSESRRTNVGLVNLGDHEAVFALGLRSRSGETVGGARAVLPANSMWHMALQLLFTAMEHGEGYSVVVETGARDTYVYASVVENSSGDASFIAPIGSR